MLLYNSFYQTDPGDMIHWGDAFYSRKDFKNAGSFYYNAGKKFGYDNKNESYTYYMKSYLCYMSALQYNEAYSSIVWAFNIKSTVVALWYRAQLVDLMNRVDTAISLMNDVIKYTPVNNEYLKYMYFDRAAMKYKKQDMQGALGDYRQAISVSTSAPEPYFYIGKFFKLKLNRSDSAITYLKKAIELCPDTVDIYAFAKLLVGEKEAAFQGMHAIIKKHENNKDQLKNDLYNMSCLYALAGNNKMAIEYLDKSLNEGYVDYSHLLNDEDLYPAKNSEDFKGLLKKYHILDMSK